MGNRSKGRNWIYYRKKSKEFMPWNLKRESIT